MSSSKYVPTKVLFKNKSNWSHWWSSLRGGGMLIWAASDLWWAYQSASLWFQAHFSIASAHGLFGGRRSAPRVGGWVASMPPVQGWHSHGRDPPSSNHDLIGLATLSSALLYLRASTRSDLQIMVASWGEEEPMSSVAWCRSMIGRGTMPQMVLLVLLVEGMPLWAVVCFLGAIGARQEAFLMKVLGWKGGRTWV